MEAEPDRPDPLPHPLHGREIACGLLRDAVAGARAGRGAAVLVVGEPGAGRSALLAEAARAAGGLTVCRIAGAEPERALPLAGLQRLLLTPPLAAGIDALPAAQARALEEVLSGREPPDGDLALGTALTRLLAQAAARRPLLWCVDDAQWLDEATLRVLGVVARRLEHLPVALAVAADPGGPAAHALAGALVVRLRGLAPAEAARVLADRGCAGAAPEAVAELLDLAEGNPLALVELAAGLKAGRVPEPPELPPDSPLRTRHRRRLESLSPPARAVVWLALVGEGLPVAVLLAAAQRLGAGPAALDEARACGLLAAGGGAGADAWVGAGALAGWGTGSGGGPGSGPGVGGGAAAGAYAGSGGGLGMGGVRVPGRLTRACVAADMPLADRQAAHAALADVLDRRSARLPLAVHSLAAGRPASPALVAELDAAAEDVRGQGDPGASASALERAAEVAPLPQTRARWLVSAAADRLAAGELRQGRHLLRRVPAHGPAPALRGPRMLVQGEIELRDGVPAVACRDLSAAVALMPASRRGLRARALMLAGEASCLAGDFTAYFALAEHARRLPGSGDPPEARLVFEHFAGMAATFRGRHDAANRALRQVVRLAEGLPDAESAIWASQAAYTLGDARRAHTLASGAVHRARRAGALALVPSALVYQALAAMTSDRHAAAEAAALEGLRLAEATGQRNLAVDHMAILALLAALQGDRASAALRMRTAAHDVAARDLGRPSAFNNWASACIDLVEDRPGDAMDRFGRMAAGSGQINVAVRGMAAPHFVEAAVRCRQHERAAGALRSFENWAASSAGTARLALAHRCHGLLAAADGPAEEHFREALRLHRDDGASLEMAKTELFYAHRLRRARKPGAARRLLRDALTVFRQFDARPWADRAAAELRAAGDHMEPTAPRGGPELTAQQLRICDLVSEGATNREIADRLVLSPRTVEYHLRNVFTRLGVRSRVELAARFR